MIRFSVWQSKPSVLASILCALAGTSCSVDSRNLSGPNEIAIHPLGTADAGTSLASMPSSDAGAVTGGVDTASSDEGQLPGGPLVMTSGQQSGSEQQPGSDQQSSAGSSGADAGSSSSCSDGATQSCGPSVERGICKFGTQTCKGSVWGDCTGAVLAQARDCSSADDNDCDGQADNLVDGVCQCTAGATQACDEHPGLDGRGQCKAGQQTCVLGPGNSTSSWGDCTGSVGPGMQDSCTVAGDDTNCDGTPNGGCTCVEGQTMPCGPANVGICKQGTSTCSGGKFSQCVGAVFPGKRDCTSSQDNDCDGKPDNTIDATCTCPVGAMQACATHPGKDGNGPCKPGVQVCQTGAGNGSSNLTACTGSVGPAQRDSCSRAGDDSDCSGIANSGCQCIAGDNSQCAADANNSRCTAQGICAPCQADADCLLVSGGRRACSAGTCVSPRCGDGRVTTGEVCDTGPVPPMASIIAGTTCNATCSAVYQRKRILLTQKDTLPNFGSAAAADRFCQSSLASNGGTWKAMIVGGGRRATVTPNKGDQQLDWVLHPFTVYVNDATQVIWATDSVALLGVDSTGVTQPLLALLWTMTNDGNYPFAGYDSDWTTLPFNMTCEEWATNDPNAVTDTGAFIVSSFNVFGAGEVCGSVGQLLCVEQ